MFSAIPGAPEWESAGNGKFVLAARMTEHTILFPYQNHQYQSQNNVDQQNVHQGHHRIHRSLRRHADDAGFTYDHTFTDDTQPGGPRERTITYAAPFVRCDRERDYARVWDVFSKRG